MDSPQRVVLDMDSTEIPVYGQQEQSAYNGHFESSCYHRCCCSIARVTVWRPSCDRATCTAPRTGKNFSCRRSSGSRSWARKWCFVPTRPLPSRRFTRHWRSGR